jgi:hypothetical protein
LAISRLLRASPKHVADPVLLAPGHQSLARKPESARKQIAVLGQRARIWAATRAISSRAPAEASMLERRSLAASRKLALSATTPMP